MTSLMTQTQEVQSVIEKDFVQELTKEVIARDIENQNDFEFVSEIYSTMRNVIKKVETEAKTLKKPHQDAINKINFDQKVFLEPCMNLITLCNRKIDYYYRKLEIEKQEEERKEREAARMLDLPVAQVYVAPVEKKLYASNATACTKSEVKFDLVDITKVPSKYIMLDEAAVKRDIKMGIRQIEGLNIYETKKTTLKVR